MTRSVYNGVTAGVNARFIGILAVSFLALIALGRLLTLLSTYAQSLLRVDIIKTISESYFRGLYNKPDKYFVHENIGSMSQRLNAASNDFFIILANTTRGVLTPLAQLALALYMIVQAGALGVAALFLVYLICYMLATYWATKLMVRIKKSMMDAGIRSYKSLSDSIQNIFAAKQYNSLGVFLGRYNDVLHDDQRIQRRYWKYTTGIGAIGSALYVVFLGAGLALSTNLVVDGKMTVGFFVMVASYIVMLTGPVETIGATFSEVRQSIATFNRFAAELQDAPSYKEGADKTVVNLADVDAICCSGLSFGYDENTLIEGQEIRVRPGTTLTLIGSSGAGKSTFLKLIAGKEVGYEGSLKVFGREVASTNLPELNEIVFFITQDEFVFQDTIRFNLKIANPDATDEEMKRALDLAMLSEELEQEGKTLDSILGDRGSTLSGGQRQRIALARLFLRRPKIILNDEGTSALDCLNEQSVLRNIRRTFPDATIVHVSHRPDIILNSERYELRGRKFRNVEPGAVSKVM
ncbi:ATP-binding cassette domain-containing protein [uncultured Desulfobacter sp.]|uniref:ATP-binding cassette domain-containing protein n=1 Tax=uncultured Desulfobacter sp. TaxID=240139 RepID=UPI0029F4744F|nr:ATP-binding cassette domain-containing protein [uncultured Desulfobacter sp.]